MAELEVDQSNLPRVQEVCQCFAVLEDGALAHNLQEQESKIYNSLISSTTLEQYYTSNIQRNQLVQKDIRVAKLLQDEEKHTAQLLQQQATRQLEERDSEYAQMIQEEIQRCAEETQRREVEDEEIAKRIQAEELCVRHRGSYQNRDDRETSSVPVPPYSPRAVHTPENRYHNRSSTRRRQHSPSPPYYSDSEEDLIEHRRPTVVTSRSHTYQNSKSSVGQSYSRPSRSHVDQDNRSTISGSTVSQKSRTSHLSGGWGDVIKLIKNDLSEQGYLSHSSEDELFEPVYKLERLLKQKQQASDSQGNRGTRLSRRSSVREDCSREERDRGRHVHFLDERRRVNALNSLNENGHIDTRERNEVVDSLSSGMPRDNHTHTRESHSDRRQTQASQSFRRNISMRRSYHGDARLSRRMSVRGGSRMCSQDDSSFVNRVRPLNNAQMEERRPGPLRWEADRHQRQRARSLTEPEQMIDGRYPGQHRVTRCQSDCWQSLEEERSSTEEERESRREVRGREERLSSRSTCQSYSGHTPRAGHGGRSGMAALDLGELEQVLLDEEMARRLQEEEERLAGGTQQGSSLKGMCPGDFRMAQVAQDEEIARFIQKQEIKVKRRSGELDANGSGREYRDMVTEYDRRGVCDRQLQRERMGSDGLQSPVDDFITELSSPVSMAAEPQLTRNIAEDLDPTFQRKEMADAGLRINARDFQGASQGSQQISLHNPIEEQPTFVPPTKRQNEKLGRGKSKDKKENMKQKENCKQQ